MELKLLISDIDGTLLNTEKKLTHYTVEKIQNFMKDGGKVVLASGRAYISMKEILENLGIHGIVISYNGAKIINSLTDEVIYHNPLNSEITQKLITFSKENNVHLNLYIGDNWYVENKDSKETEYYSKLAGKSPIALDFNSLKDTESTKALFFAENNVLKKIEKELKEIIGNEVDFTYSRPEFLEILNKGVNKGTGIKKVVDILGISPENCIAFGDELNDLEMLKFVKYGVAMENANTEVKNQIIHKTLKNNENGVAKFLEDVTYCEKISYLDSLMKKTRTKRSFYRETIFDNILEKIINSARFAGSARNAQEIRYVSINSKDTVNNIFSFTKWAGAIEWNPDLSEGPSSYILMCSHAQKPTNDNFFFDMGLAAQNILLKAKEEGYDCCIIASYNKEEVNKIINLPEEYKSHYLIALGKGKEEVAIVPGIENNLSYYRVNGEHFVPKLPIEKLIIKKL